MLMRKSKRS